MARQSEFYKGRRKRRNYAIIPGVGLLLFFSVLVVLFYSTQKYAVIADDGVSVELPLLSSGKTSYDASGNEVVNFDPVHVEIQFQPADYSAVAAVAGKKVKPLRAIFVPYDDVTPDRIPDYSSRLSSGNALLLELKQKNGFLAWYSNCQMAYSYGLNMNAVESTDALKSIIASLKEDGIYLVAQISCCMDELLGAHSTEVSIFNQYGSYYYDESGYWLDPYSTIVRDYAAQLVRELWDMGFDEVVLCNVCHPVAEEIENPDGSFTSPFVYNHEMSTEPTPVGGVSGFAVNVAEQLSDRDDGKFLSIYLDSSTALSKVDEKNGQDPALFFKLYDRVFYKTDKYAYNFNVPEVEKYCTVGSIKDRFIPVVINYLPENTSWVLIDQNS